MVIVERTQALVSGDEESESLCDLLYREVAELL